MENRVKERLHEMGITQAELAVRCGMTRTAMNLLTNPEKIVKVETFEKFAKAMGVPVWKLMLSDDEIAEIVNEYGNKMIPESEYVEIDVPTPAKENTTKEEPRSLASQITAATFICPNCGSVMQLAATVCAPSPR